MPMFVISSGVRSGHPSTEHIVLVHDRGEQAQDGPAAVAHVPGHLPQGHDLQLSVHRAAGPKDKARVPRLRSVFRRPSVSNKTNATYIIINLIYI